MNEIPPDVDALVNAVKSSGKELFWQGAASELQIDTASAAIGVEFPPSFRRFLLKFGGGGVIGEEISGIESDNGFLETKGSILGDTRRCR